MNLWQGVTFTTVLVYCRTGVDEPIARRHSVVKKVVFFYVYTCVCASLLCFVHSHECMRGLFVDPMPMCIVQLWSDDEEIPMDLHTACGCGDVEYVYDDVVVACGDTAWVCVWVGMWVRA